MALIYCPECGTQVSEHAVHCIKCAYPISSLKGKINQQDYNASQYYQATHTRTNFQSQEKTPSKIEVNNSIVWVLALAPLIGSFIQGFIVGVFYGDNWFWHYGKFWWITIALNILLCYLDDNKLKESGIKTDSLGSTWLIPIYLYKRSELLNDGKAYFIVWIVTFTLTFLNIL
jgi:hypothetical protein